MAKVGYILKADHYDGFNDDINGWSNMAAAVLYKNHLIWKNYARSGSN